VGPLGGFNKMACGPKLFHSTSALLVVWWGLLWLSVWSTVHTTWSPVSESIVKASAYMVGFPKSGHKYNPLMVFMLMAFPSL